MNCFFKRFLRTEREAIAPGNENVVHVFEGQVGGGGGIASTSIIKEFKVWDSCKVTINGDPAEFTDLRSRDRLILDGSPALSITATREVK